MTFKKNIIAATVMGALSLGSLVGLSACTSTQVAETSYTVSTVYVAAHKIVVQYAEGTFGTPDTAVTKKLVELDSAASMALVALDTAEANGTDGVTTAATLANDAVQALITYIDQNNIGKTTTTTTTGAN